MKWEGRTTAAVLAATLVAPVSACSPWELNKPIVDLSALPDELPQAVQKAELRAVVIDVVPDTNPYASGVLITGREVLTAGHALYDSQSHAYPDLEICGSIRVVGRRQAVTATGNGQDGGFKSMATYAFQFDGTRNADHSVPDAAILRVPSNAFPKLGEIGMRENAVKPGEALYFINYQPVSDKESRDPALLDTVGNKSSTQRSFPAVFGGIALTNGNDNKLHVLTGVKSYGKIQDMTAMPGGSGGMVVDGQGRLIGEVVESEIDKRDIDDIADNNGVIINGADDNRSSATVARVQLTSRSYITKLRNEAKHANGCIVDPQ